VQSQSVPSLVRLLAVCPELFVGTIERLYSLLVVCTQVVAKAGLVNTEEQVEVTEDRLELGQELWLQLIQQLVGIPAIQPTTGSTVDKDIVPLAPVQYLGAIIVLLVKLLDKISQILFGSGQFIFVWEINFLFGNQTQDTCVSNPNVYSRQNFTTTLLRTGKS
jgi:hypothetical protein